MKTENRQMEKPVNQKKLIIQIEREINHLNWTPDFYRQVILQNKNSPLLELLTLITDENDIPKHLEYNKKIILNTENRDSVLKEMYYNLETGLTGGDLLFKRIYNKYLGITQFYVRKWLKEQELAQRFSQSRANVVVRPFVVYKPRSIWQMDLIDMVQEKDGHYKYILNVIDCFSKKCWIRPLTSKSSQGIAKKLKEILNKEGQEWWPTTIRSDNGGEFMGVTSILFDKLPYSKIQRSYSEAYHPNENAIVERANRNIRQLLRKHFRLTGTYKDWPKLLTKIEENINNSFNISINTTPNSIHYQNKTAEIKEIRMRIKKRAKDTLEKRGIENITGKIKVGDNVRIARNKYKFGTAYPGGKMQIATDFSKEIYIVSSVHHDYIHVEGDIKRYYSNQFKLIPKKIFKISDTIEIYKDKIYKKKEQIPNPTLNVLKEQQRKKVTETRSRTKQ